MSAYSSFTIDGVDVVFDPDSVAVTNSNLIAVNRSMGGTSYITSYDANTPAYSRTLSISGVFLSSTAATTLLASSSKKTSVSIGGGLLGTAGKYIILSLSLNPVKPLISYPTGVTGAADVKYSYTINLQEVDA